MAPRKKAGLTRVRFLTHVTHGFAIDSELFPSREERRMVGTFAYTEQVPHMASFEAGKVYDLPDAEAEQLLDRGLVEEADASEKPENEAELVARARVASAAADERAAKRSTQPSVHLAPLATAVDEEDGDEPDGDEKADG